MTKPSQPGWTTLGQQKFVIIQSSVCQFINAKRKLSWAALDLVWIFPTGRTPGLVLIVKYQEIKSTFFVALIGLAR